MTFLLSRHAVKAVVVHLESPRYPLAKGKDSLHASNQPGPPQTQTAKEKGTWGWGLEPHTETLGDSTQKRGQQCSSSTPQEPVEYKGVRAARYDGCDVDTVSVRASSGWAGPNDGHGSPSNRRRNAPLFRGYSRSTLITIDMTTGMPHTTP